MADIADMAQDQEERLRTQALKQLQQLNDGYKVDTDTPRFCEDCEEQILLARVKAVPHCTRCVECQERSEKCQRL